KKFVGQDFAVTNFYRHFLYFPWVSLFKSSFCKDSCFPGLPRFFYALKFISEEKIEKNHLLHFRGISAGFAGCQIEGGEYDVSAEFRRVYCYKVVSVGSSKT